MICQQHFSRPPSILISLSHSLSLSIPLAHYVLKPDRSSLYLCSPLILSCRSQIPFGRTVDFSAPSNSKMIVVACNCIRHQWLSHWVLRVRGGERAERWKQSTHFTFATNVRFDKHKRRDFVFICGKPIDFVRCYWVKSLVQYRPFLLFLSRSPVEQENNVTPPLNSTLLRPTVTKQLSVTHLKLNVT